ncbi:hypothetical protein CT138_00555 [Mannheimia varigena]|nr:hypothetical protein CT138_00555 [Mannheimia varigena]
MSVWLTFYFYKRLNFHKNLQIFSHKTHCVLNVGFANGSVIENKIGNNFVSNNSPLATRNHNELHQRQRQTLPLFIQRSCGTWRMGAFKQHIY